MFYLTALLPLVLVSASGSSLPSSFDLICTGTMESEFAGKAPYKEELRVDLSVMSYCYDELCDRGLRKIHDVNKYVIVFDEPRDADDARGMRQSFVNRATGRYKNVQMGPNGSNKFSIVDAVCVPAPFKGFSDGPPKF